MLNASDTLAPPRPYKVLGPTPKLLARSEEMALLEKAFAADPANRGVQERLSQMYFAHDRFDDAIALLRTYCAAGESDEALHTLGLCLLAKETPEDTDEAIRVLQRAVDIAVTPRTASFALSAIGKAYLRKEQLDEARVVLAEAIDRYRNNKDAFKRLTMCDFLADRPQDALALADRLIDAGTLHARTFAVKAMALARMGRLEEARAAFGLEQFLKLNTLKVPDGWDDLGSFNRDVAAELVNHPGYHYERYGAASTQTWRVDDPELARCKAVRALIEAVKGAVEEYVNQLRPGEHPWPNGRTDGAEIHSWAVITYGNGFEEWHVHQNGWISGAYYIEVPDGIRNGTDHGGCIGFGLPESLVGDEAHEAFGMHMVRPRPGLLALFPSHTFHRTFPYQGSERRICFAFDIAAPPPHLGGPPSAGS